MARSPFVWGDNGEQLTPERVEALRAAVIAAQRQAQGRQIKNVWEGLASLTDAWGGYKGNLRADREETEGRAGAKSVIDALLGGGGGAYGAPSVSSMGGGSPGGTWTPGQAPKVTDTPGMEGGGSFGLPAAPAVGGGADLGFGSATMTPQEMIIAGAEARGLNPIDVATAISYETGGTFDPVKAGPTTQWGQHRGLIQFGEPQAQQYGADFSSPEAAMRSQLDPTKGAVWNYLDQTGVQPGMGLDNIYSAINAGAPGRFNASDANNGGAPGTVADKVAGMGDHRAKAAQFLGGTWTPAAGGNVTMSAQNAPSASGYAPQMQGTSPVMQALLQASTDPWVAQEYGPVLQALMGQEQSRQQFAMEQADPMRQLEMQKAQLEIEQMRNPDAPKPIEVGGVLLDPVTYQPIFDSRANGGDIPDSVQALDLRAQRAGLTPGTPAYNEFMIAGGSGKGQTINVGGNNDIGTIPAGMMVTRDQAGNVTGMQPIPGGPAEAELRAREAQQAGAQGQKATSGNIVTQDIDRAIALIDQPGIIPTTGMGASLTSSIGGTAGNDLRNLLDTVKANSAFATLAQMRAASPTGGALGAVSDTELGLLTAAQGALDQSQSPQQLKDNLARLNNITLDIVHGPGNGPARKPLSFDEESKKTSATPTMIRTMTLQELSMVPLEELDEAGLDALEQRFEELSQ